MFFDIGTVVTVFGPRRPGTARPDLGYDLTLAAAAPGPVTTSAGVPVRAQRASTRCRRGPRRRRRLDAVARRRPARGARRARAAHARGARVMSICTGAFVLAHAGLLDGRRRRRTGASAPARRASSPRSRSTPTCSTSTTATCSPRPAVGRDRPVPARRARRPRRRRGDRDRALERRRRRTATAARRSTSTARCPPATAAAWRATRAWALERLHEPLTVEALARHAHMSPRTFARRFRAETGHAPKRWLTAQRIHHARRLLETTDLPVEDVAQRSGSAAPPRCARTSRGRRRRGRPPTGGRSVGARAAGGRGRPPA